MLICGSSIYHSIKSINQNLFGYKGHAGHPENERCDYLAVKAAEGYDLLVDQWYEQNKNNLSLE